MNGRRLAWLACLLAGLFPAVQADDAKSPAKPAAVPEVDDELLEFLGSVDSDDDDWLEFLSRTDVGKAWRKAQAGKSAPTAATEVSKDD